MILTKIEFPRRNLMSINFQIRGDYPLTVEKLVMEPQGIVANEDIHAVLHGIASALHTIAVGLLHAPSAVSAHCDNAFSSPACSVLDIQIHRNMEEWDMATPPKKRGAPVVTFRGDEDRMPPMFWDNVQIGLAKLFEEFKRREMAWIKEQRQDKKTCDPFKDYTPGSIPSIIEPYCLEYPEE